MNFRAREIQIRMPGCPTHYTNMQRAIDILKNPAFWMFVAAVVLINTFVSPRNLDTWGGFVRVVGGGEIWAVGGRTAAQRHLLHLHNQRPRALE